MPRTRYLQKMDILRSSCFVDNAHKRIRDIEDAREEETARDGEYRTTRGDERRREATRADGREGDCREDATAWNPVISATKRAVHLVGARWHVSAPSSGGGGLLDRRDERAVLRAPCNEEEQRCRSEYLREILLCTYACMCLYVRT